MQIEEIVDEIHHDAHNGGRNDVLHDDIGVNDIARMAVDKKQVQGGAIGIPSKSIRDIVLFPCGTIPGSFYDFAGCSVLRCGGQLPLRYKFTQILLNL